MVHDPLQWRMYALTGFCVLLLLVVNPIRRFMSINFVTMQAARWVTDHGEPGTWEFNQSAAAVHADSRLHLVMTYSSHSVYTRRRAQLWRTLNPGTTVEVYDNANSSRFVGDVYGDAMRRLLEWIPAGPIKADLFRTLYLYACGGLYADIDAVPVQTIHTMYSGVPWAVPYLYVPHSRHNGQLNPMLIMASPRHPTLAAVIHTYARLNATGAKFAYWKYSIVHILTALQWLGHSVDMHLHETCKYWDIRTCRIATKTDDTALWNRGTDWDNEAHTFVQ